MVNRSKVAGILDLAAGTAMLLSASTVGGGFDTTPFYVNAAFGVVMIIAGLYFYNQGLKE